MPDTGILKADRAATARDLDRVLEAAEQPDKVLQFTCPVCHCMTLFVEYKDGMLHLSCPNQFCQFQIGYLALAKGDAAP